MRGQDEITCRLHSDYTRGQRLHRDYTRGQDEITCRLHSDYTQGQRLHGDYTRGQEENKADLCHFGPPTTL